MLLAFLILISRLKRHQTVIIRLLDDYLKADIITEKEKSIYLDFYNQNKPELLKPGNTEKLEKDIERRLSKRVSMKNNGLNEKLKKKGFLGDLRKRNFELNEDLLTERGKKEVSYNLFKNENLGAKLNFVGEYLKGKRRVMVEKKVREVEMDIQPLKGINKRRGIINRLSMLKDITNY